MRLVAKFFSRDQRMRLVASPISMIIIVKRECRAWHLDLSQKVKPKLGNETCTQSRIVFSFVQLPKQSRRSDSNSVNRHCCRQEKFLYLNVEVTGAKKQRSWLLTFCMILFNGGKRNYALVHTTYIH